MNEKGKGILGGFLTINSTYVPWIGSPLSTALDITVLV